MNKQQYIQLQFNFNTNPPTITDANNTDTNNTDTNNTNIEDNSFKGHESED